MIADHQLRTQLLQFFPVADVNAVATNKDCESLLADKSLGADPLSLLRDCVGAWLVVKTCLSFVDVSDLFSIILPLPLLNHYSVSRIAVILWIKSTRIQ